MLKCIFKIQNKSESQTKTNYTAIKKKMGRHYMRIAQ